MRAAIGFRCATMGAVLLGEWESAVGAQPTVWPVPTAVTAKLLHFRSACSTRALHPTECARLGLSGTSRPRPFRHIPTSTQYATTTNGAAEPTPRADDLHEVGLHQAGPQQQRSNHQTAPPYIPTTPSQPAPTCTKSCCTRLARSSSARVSRQYASPAASTRWKVVARASAWDAYSTWGRVT